jgi:hypothetical protein
LDENFEAAVGVRISNGSAQVGQRDRHTDSVVSVPSRRVYGSVLASS